MYQKRQKMIHMQLHENNFDINHIYLQRRQLNIQDEEHINYQSDDEEQKVYDANDPDNANQAEVAAADDNNNQLLGNGMPAQGAQDAAEGNQV